MRRLEAEREQQQAQLAALSRSVTQLGLEPRAVATSGTRKEVSLEYRRLPLAGLHDSHTSCIIPPNGQAVPALAETLYTG